MIIERLDRYNDYEDKGDGNPQLPSEDGVYVLYDKYRAREKLLLDALKELSESCWSNKRGGGIEIHSPVPHILTKAIETVDDIEASQ